jgi:hypothetical protein
MNMTSKQLKLAAASIGAGAALAMGALGAAFVASPEGTAAVGQDPEITLGETTTSETAPTELETSVASPTVTAEPAPEA